MKFQCRVVAAQVNQNKEVKTGLEVEAGIALLPPLQGPVAGEPSKRAAETWAPSKRIRAFSTR